ncbi:transcriptional regulator, MerR family [Actinosynnema mirum DSM 43827]|uniref:Transcriptional regulator, MerR family n=1 Tax=Actinosynnema mirum (strain ATCC 29888 / DSM 43827 / JCM 3225 / NBRC 14064 / NCIMB 13271 / NRRL B-12336 / IMRU 3971 / 101) TaxID=446462 RepID=C6WRT1_ACTMD|nr:transcriptional regulator, MerR family [Actinosynnema mirum DSM 43827]
MATVTDDQLYPIGDVARRTGLSVSAIRFYADEGVIEPTAHTDAGYRLYDVAAIARLELVRTLRDLGAGLDDIRGVLKDEMSLRELASAHLDVVEGQMRTLKARRAVLHTIVNQNSDARQVSLLHDLVNMSDDARDRLLDDFWTEVTGGLPIHPGYQEHLRRTRPVLPEEPTAEQLQAWIALADMVGDAEFRASVRHFYRQAFATPRSDELTSPQMVARSEEHSAISLEAWKAERAGTTPESPEARELAERLLRSTGLMSAEMTGQSMDEEQWADLRGLLSEPEANPEVTRFVEGFTADFGGVFEPFFALLATINDVPLEELWNTGPSDAWVAAALRAGG